MSLQTRGAGPAGISQYAPNTRSWATALILNAICRSDIREPRPVRDLDGMKSVTSSGFTVSGPAAQKSAVRYWTLPISGTHPSSHPQTVSPVTRAVNASARLNVAGAVLFGAYVGMVPSIESESGATYSVLTNRTPVP